MVDPKVLSLKKNILEGLIDAYYDAKIDLFAAPADAVANAVMHFGGQINPLQDFSLKLLIASNNKNTATAGFLLDVVQSIVGPVLVPQPAEVATSPYLIRIIENRKRDLDILNFVIRNVKIKKLFDTHQNNISSFSDELTPEVSEHTAKLIKRLLKRPTDTVAKELKEQEAGRYVGAASVLEFIEHYTPAGREVFTETWEKFLSQRDMTKDSKVEQIKALYNKKEREEQNVLETITKMAAGVRSYSKIQVRFDDLFRGFFQFMRKAIDDPGTLDIITKYFQNQLKLLSGITFIDEDKWKFEQFFGATFWLLYLGHPKEYMQDPAVTEFVRIKEDELRVYEIKNLEGDFYISLGGEQINVGSEVRNIQPPLYRAKVNLNIPYDLALYLTGNFGNEFGTESFIGEAKRIKREVMRKEGGFGIDAPLPVNRSQSRVVDLKAESLKPYRSFYIDPIYEAVESLIEWFLKIDGALNENHELKTILEGKGFKPSLIRQFRLPKR